MKILGSHHPLLNKAESACIKNAVNILCGTVFSLFFMSVYGYLVIVSLKEFLIQKSLFIEAVNGLSLPSSLNLISLTAQYFFNSGVFFGFSLGVPLGITISLIIFALNASALKKKIKHVALLLIGSAIYLYAGRNFYPKISFCMFLLLPFVINLGYSLSFYIQKKLSQTIYTRLLNRVNTSGNTDKRKNRPFWFFSGLSILTLFLFIFFLLFFVKPHRMNFIEIRDNFLLPTSIGKKINSFYYLHSPLAAEVLKPIQAKRQITSLYIGKNRHTLQLLKKLSLLMRYYSTDTTDKEELKMFLTKGGIDLFIIDEDLSKESKKDFTLLPLLSQFKQTVFPRSFLLRDENKKSTTPLFTDIPYKVKKPLTNKNLTDALQYISGRQDNSKAIRAMLKFFLFDSLSLFAGVIFILLIAFILHLIVSLYKIIPAFRYTNSIICLMSLFLIFSIGKITLLSRSAMRKNKVFKSLKTGAGKNEIENLLPYLKNNDKDIRYRAAYLLSHVAKNKDTRLLLPFLKSLDDIDPRVRMYSSLGLGNLHHKKAVSKLIGKLDDPQLNVRYKSAEALGKIGDRRAITPLMRIIKEGNSWYTSDYALRALKKIQRKIKKKQL